MTTIPLPVPAGLPFASVLSDGTGETTRYRVLRRDDGVRALVPDAGVGVLREVLGRANDPEPWSRHVARQGFATGAGLGLLATERAHLADATLRTRLEALVEGSGLEFSHLAVHFGPPRPNRKPVVHLLDDRGVLVAVAKIGAGPVPAALVLREAAALAALSEQGPLVLLQVPTVVGVGPGPGDSTVLVQTALPVAGRARLPQEPERRRALVELSTGRTSTGARAWLDGLAARLDDLPDADALTDPDARELVDAARALVAEAEEAGWVDDVRCGPSHGDWARQNVVGTPDGVAAWDWERYDRDRPVGYDEAHLALQEVRRAASSGRRTQRGGSRLQASADAFARWQPPHQAGARPERDLGLARLLVLDLVARYGGDATTTAGGDAARVQGGLARLAGWTLPLLRETA
ncbi:hypothetical protein [Nocardioides bruguierae]|uniref:hypothetical protein n=1 Tax=Nocardioides bruguierae TaxID=2945102 RepID=UPI002020A427|nr:hypothetical protein [Nocardioides bruguierae]MCL8027260.1 hypothetical protein [Nocardioides bruguierae]